MTDFLGSLISRSIPPRDRSEMRAQLSPRLPSLFEPAEVGPDESGPIQEAPPGPIAAVAENRPSSVEQSPSRTIVPSADAYLSQPRTARLSPEHDSEDRPSDSKEDIAQTPPVQQTAVAPVWPQILRHEPAEVEQPRPEPAPAAHSFPGLVPAPRPSMTPGRQEHRFENATALIDQPSGTTVHINIGRIEVRAVHPPQPPAQPRKTIPQTRLTIEEYSKQRNEGKR